MRRMVAWAIYVLGTILALRALVGGFADSGLYEAFSGVALAAVIWG